MSLLMAASVVATVSCTSDTGPIPTPRYELTLASTAGGSASLPGEGVFTYDTGTIVNLAATPASGYEFASWTGDVGTVADVTAASTTITMTGHCSITANFAPISPVRYNLTVASTAGGSVTTPGEGTFIYDAGTEVDLMAAPAGGYRFVDWSGNGVVDPDSARTTVTMDADRDVTANFAPLTCRLTLDHTAGGLVTAPGSGPFSYDYGAAVDLAAVPVYGYRFAGWTGDVAGVDNVQDAQTRVTIKNNYSITASFERVYSPMVAGGRHHTVGLSSDGSIIATGDNAHGQCSVDGWTGMVQLDAGEDHTVGLTADGTVVAVGYNAYGQCNVGDWAGIVQVDAGRRHTLGLKSDGTVVAVGYNEWGQCDVGGWTDIIQVASGANSWHTVGLRSDGTVVATGNNASGQCNVSDWTGIIQLAAGAHHTVGLRPDGTVVAVGRNLYGECSLGGWRDIIQIAAGSYLTVGLRSDGTVVTAGSNSSGQSGAQGWTDIVQINAGVLHIVGLRLDGTVVAVGNNNGGQCDVSSWLLS